MKPQELTKKDYTPNGLRIEGQYENDRNAQSADLFKCIIRECYNVTDVIIAHHLVYVKVEKRDGFDYQIVEEVPSADALIFDHDVAKRLWGGAWRDNLTLLALEPVETRDKLLAQLYADRSKTPKPALSGKCDDGVLAGAGADWVDHSNCARDDYWGDRIDPNWQQQ